MERDTRNLATSTATKPILTSPPLLSRRYTSLSQVMRCVFHLIQGKMNLDAIVKSTCGKCTRKENGRPLGLKSR